LGNGGALPLAVSLPERTYLGSLAAQPATARCRPDFGSYLSNGKSDARCMRRRQSPRIRLRIKKPGARFGKENEAGLEGTVDVPKGPFQNAGFLVSYQ